MQPMPDIERMRSAATRIDPLYLRTPLVSSATIDAALGCALLAKIETDNPIGSFKGRGDEWSSRPRCARWHTRWRSSAVVACNAVARKRSLDARRVVRTRRADTMADGIAGRVPIAHTLARLRRCCDHVVAVSEPHPFDAMNLLYRHLGCVVEPARAAGVAAVLAEPRRYAGRRVATIISGANITSSLRALQEARPHDAS
jgi:threonine dehydratase